MQCDKARPRTWPACAFALLLSGCSGIQSALAPAGYQAERIATLFWWMAGGALIVWGAVIALAMYCARLRAGASDRRRDNLLIVGAGIVVPVLVLTVLLLFGLSMIPRHVARAPEGALQIAVSGEQWWWRVRYLRPGAPPIELANEIRRPVGEPVQFRLDSDNVIHSFWIPSMGGKIDMIPGRVTHLALHPSITGIFRGACAEYCGTSHALMSFYVEVLQRDAFTRWIDHQASPALTPAEPLALEGQRTFETSGCSACHTIRGTSARGVIGPDLTHVGSRLSLGAGVLANEPDAFRRWIADTERIKPGVHMPHFGMLPIEDVRALAAYLEGLQ
jgi:cytochrome c oxidase subunit 2